MAHDFFYICRNKSQMKKNILLIVFVLISSLTIAQKKEKIKGNKIVTIQKHDVTPFSQIEIEDNLEVFLSQGDINSIEIETDENLHKSIDFKVYGNTLRLSTNKDITSFKKLDVKITYTDKLDMIIAKNESRVNASAEVRLENITIKTFDYSKSFMNINSPNFTLQTNDKSKMEMNLKSKDAFIEMSKNSDIKALITSNKLKFDMYQKSYAEIEGDVNEMKLRLDNTSNCAGKKLSSKLLDVTVEGNTKCSIKTDGNLSISASGKSEVTIYGDPKIELKKFSDEATLYKKIAK
jgi:hypothetical protein